MAQNLKSINDSIEKYKIIDPQKSLDFGFEALSFSTYDDYNKELYNTNYLLGETLFYLKLYNQAFDYLTASLKIYEALSDSEKEHRNIVKPPWVLVILGNVYYNTKKYDRAEQYYAEAIENFNLYGEKYSVDKAFGLNTAEGNIALINITRKEYQKAEKQFENILARRKKMGKISDIMYSYIQLSLLYFDMDQKEKALDYLDLIKKIFETESQKSTFDPNSEIQLYYSHSLLNYGNFLFKKKDYEKALEIFYQSKKLEDSFPSQSTDIAQAIAATYIQTKAFLKAEELIEKALKTPDIAAENKIKFFEQLSEIYKQTKNYSKLIAVKDSLIWYATNPKYDPFNELENLEIQITLAEKQNELIENRIKYNNTLFFTAIAILILLFLLLFIRANLKLQNERQRVLETEKREIENELDLKKRELLSKTNFILQRNDYLKILRSSLNEKKSSEVLVKKTQREISNLINSEKSYDEFDKKFVEVFPDFYKKLNEQYSLSKVDLRLIAYIKMNKSNNEIANISGISLRTVQSQRYRLSKKLRLKPNQDLNKYIHIL